MKNRYVEQAVTCVKDTVLPAQIRLYKSCGGDFDKIYGEAMNGNGYFGKVIESGRVYELGYERCTCPKVLSGEVTDPEQCECSRQSILYILRCLEPDSGFEVGILETVLRGAEHCRFRITRDACVHAVPESGESGERCRGSAEEKRIVPVDETNLDQAAVIHSVSWKEAHRSFCSPDFIELHSPERQRAWLSDKMKNGARLYMLTDGKPLGIVSVTNSLIEDLYVLPDRQNRGCGTELLKFAIERCEDTPTLWILENNTDAGRLYRRMGFTETGRRQRITDGLDEIEFERKADHGGKRNGQDPGDGKTVPEGNGQGRS